MSPAPHRPTVMPLLRVEGISKSFSVGNLRPIVIQGISFSVAPGEVVGLLGPSGCGKTTLLDILAGFTRPDEGCVMLNGNPVNAPGPERAVVFQEDTLFPWMTVNENLGLGLVGRKIPAPQKQEMVSRFLSLVGLDGYGDYLPGAISGGMKQRVALARVLVLFPSILLMDEPFAALDAQTRLEMHALLVNLQENLRQTIVFVTHDLEEVVRLSDRVLVMGGKPGGINGEFNIDLPKPRDNASGGFISLKQKLYECLTHGRARA